MQSHPSSRHVPKTPPPNILRAAAGSGLESDKTEPATADDPKAVNAGGGTQSEAAAHRTQFRQLARDRKLICRFSAEEQKAIRAVTEAPTTARVLGSLGGIRNSIVGGLLGSGAGSLIDLGLPRMAAGSVAGVTAARTIGALGREMGDRAAIRASETELARAFGATSRLPAMTPSTGAKAFGSAFTFGAGLEVGRKIGE